MSKKAKYRVGRGKPPRKTQFKRGVSGNPAGRPKGSPNVNKVFDKELRRKIFVTQTDGKRRAISKLQAAATQHANKAAQGDPRSIAQVLKRAEAIDSEADRQSPPRTLICEDDQKVIAHVLERMRRALQANDAEAKPDVRSVQTPNWPDHDPSDPK